MHWPYTITIDGALPPTYVEKDLLHKSLYTTATLCAIKIAMCDCDIRCNVCNKSIAFITAVDKYFLTLVTVDATSNEGMDLSLDIMEKNVTMNKALLG